MKNAVYKTLCVFGLLVCLLGVAVPKASAAEDDQRRKITVSGEAQVNVTPDVVIFRVSIQTTDKSMAEAKRQSDGHVAALSNAVKGFGILPQDINSEYISVGGYSGGQQGSARRIVEITLKEVAKFESFLDVLLRLEGITLQNIEFRTNSLRKYKDQARSLAVKAAKEKAQAMAGDLGQKVGKPITITEDVIQWWSYYSYYYRSYGSSYIKTVDGANATINVPPPTNTSAPTVGETLAGDASLAPGQISITARVMVVFELAD